MKTSKKIIKSYIKTFDQLKLLLIHQDNGARKIKNHIAKYCDRAYTFILPVPEPSTVIDEVPVVTFVLNTDWSEELLYLLQGTTFY